MDIQKLSHSERFHKFRRKLFNSRFFTISVVLHAILVVILGGTVLIQQYVEPPDFTGEGGGGFVAEQASALPPQMSQPIPQPQFNVTTPTTQSNAPAIQAITSAGVSQATFTLPSITTPTISPTATSMVQQVTQQAPQMGAAGMTAEAAAGISGFTSGWAPGGGGGPGSNIKARKFAFTAYLAKYSGGDWNSTVRLSKGKIVGGSLPNLLYIMGQWSGERISADAQAEPLDLSSPDIFAKKPPFILFTGHKDFTLTEKEVENLRKYIRLGGCIWGDSSLPGLRSRFDIAFRREMRRVVPDVDKDFEPLPSDHPIFSKAYYPEIKTPPQGINYYAEPVYALKIYGEIAVIYTPNDYGDMWQFALNKEGQFDTRRGENKELLFMNTAMWQLNEVYFRNIEPAPVAACYKFGTNVITHLLTRWEDKLRFVPKGL